MKNNRPNDQREAERFTIEAITLWDTACQLVMALEDMAQKHPELLRPIARQIFFWPGFISRKRAFDTPYPDAVSAEKLSTL